MIDRRAAARSAHIGRELHSPVNELLGHAGKLSGVVDGSLSGVVAETRERLERHASRIAVIGQMKAGKSSFINALLQRPGLLPTDVNPWTAVVTHLHFGIPGEPTHGSLFSFFDAGEWQRLAEGGGRIRELTERLVPGLEHDQLKRQLEHMRIRARRRLGDQFHHLLGKRHKFERVSTEILERYICAGPPPDELVRNPEPGRYAGITKSADLFFDLDPFACPTELIDTPGTNDPFLVRDEITRRSLEAVDMYIVVLTAHQAL